MDCCICPADPFQSADRDLVKWNGASCGDGESHGAVTTEEKGSSSDEDEEELPGEQETHSKRQKL